MAYDGEAGDVFYDLLVNEKASSTTSQQKSQTAAQVCFCPRMRKQLPTKLQSTLERNKALTGLKPGLQDKDAIFKLASNPKSFYELQKKLQMFDFSVNSEKNENGDHLLHIASRCGISQLPAIVSLVRLQHADIDVCNADGMTPLMIVASEGDSIMCDILMCLFNADPNKCNERTGQTALHYAVYKNHVNVVSCLLKRGADVNIEDNDSYLPDDIPVLYKDTLDCQEVIVLHRKQRNQQLSEMVREDTVYPIDLRETDLHMVDSEGYTLIMLAAKHDKVHNLETLLGVNSKTVNAQHGQTGLTALGMAASAGHHGACDVLLRFDANSSIGDINPYLPLHHAVLGNHEEVVDVFMKHFPIAYVGLSEALKLCRKSSIHDKLTAMYQRRQEEVVNSELRLCAMSGNAERLFNVLEQGDNVNCKSDLNSQPALIIAVQNSHLDVVKLLKEHGADLTKRDQHSGSSILHVVAQTGHLDLAKYLLQFCKSSPQTGTTYKLDINAMNNDQKTALQIAAERGYIKMTALFIEHGATTSILNSRGELFTCPEFEGVRLQIEAQRTVHTKQIMKLVADKSKQALVMLEKVWVPRFDHNLRDENGDTPLMIACHHGRLEIIKFLLQSAVYAYQFLEEDENSDTDSGVPDLPPRRSRKESLNHSEASMEQSCEYGETLAAMGVSYVADDKTKSLNPSDRLTSSYARREPYVKSPQLDALLQDVEKPKGLYIYHDGIVSHVCAVNLFNGDTPLHRGIEGGDSPVIVSSLVEADCAVINMQNDAGLTAIHLACKLRRKKVLGNLLAVEGIDTSLRSLDGHLPEEMTTNKSLIRMVQKARKDQPVRPHLPPDILEYSGTLTESLSSLPSTIGPPSTVNFTHVYEKYKTLTTNRETERLDCQSLPPTSKKQL